MSRYTNAVLTVIAIALVGLVVENAVPLVHAQMPAIQRVMICDPSNSTTCVNVSPVGPPEYHQVALRVYQPVDPRH